MKHIALLLCALMLLSACEQAAPTGSSAQTPGPAENVALIAEQQAYHIGTLAYLWGYPMVDMSKQMHNETHRIRPDQQVYAPLNHFYRFEYLVTPETAGNLRAANNDTLYFGGWFDLRDEPIVVRAPDTHGRYYTLAITDFYSEVEHVGRRTTGTEARDFALIGPDFEGELPEGLYPVRLRTQQSWILGRLLVDGEADLPQAVSLLRGFKAAPLSEWQQGHFPEHPEPLQAQPLEPLHSLEFFSVLNRWLRANPITEQEKALVAQFDQIGVGPNHVFDPDNLDEASRRGLERAIADGRALVKAASNRPLPNPDVRNGWIFPLELGRSGFDYLMRASIVYGGYANLPEESTYVALIVGPQGQPLSGQERYRLHFSPEQIPPAAGFWSISAYDRESINLIPNPIARYSIGNRTPGLEYGDDGSLKVVIQREEPAEGISNWLPVGDGPFYLIMRIYEPQESVFDGSYYPPVIEIR